VETTVAKKLFSPKLLTIQDWYFVVSLDTPVCTFGIFSTKIWRGQVSITGWFDILMAAILNFKGSNEHYYSINLYNKLICLIDVSQWLFTLQNIKCELISPKYSHFHVFGGHLEFWVSGLLFNLAPYLNRFRILLWVYPENFMLLSTFAQFLCFHQLTCCTTVPHFTHSPLHTTFGHRRPQRSELDRVTSHCISSGHSMRYDWQQ